MLSFVFGASEFNPRFGLCGLLVFAIWPIAAIRSVTISDFRASYEQAARRAIGSAMRKACVVNFLQQSITRYGACDGSR